MPEFLHVDADQLFLDSLRLGRMIYESGFRPKHAISLWRGGTPVGLGVDAFFKMRGFMINHTTVTTASYSGIAQRQKEVTVRGLEHVIEAVCCEDKLLIIDDVYESGETIEKIITAIREEARANAPKEILVATVHRKPGCSRYSHNLISLHDVDAEVWVDYPHELADLVRDEDPEDEWIRAKDPEIHQIIHTQGGFQEAVMPIAGDYHYMTSREMQLDALKLGMNIYERREEFLPDFMIALWPGGILSGLPIHEVLKYRLRKDGAKKHRIDHVSLNTSRSYASYKTNIIGMKYLERAIQKHDRVLIIDSTFRSGRVVNDVAVKLKSVLRRNLSLDHIRVASVYFNPDDKATWISNPALPEPHYYLKVVNREIIYPHNIFKLHNPEAELRNACPEAYEIVFGERP